MTDVLCLQHLAQMPDRVADRAFKRSLVLHAARQTDYLRRGLREARWEGSAARFCHCNECCRLGGAVCGSDDSRGGCQCRPEIQRVGIGNAILVANIGRRSLNRRRRERWR